MTNLSTHFPIHQDATAQQWDVKSGKTAYIPAGKVTGNGYFPGMMKFDGSTGYYNKSGIAISGNLATIMARFSVPSTAGTAVMRVAGVENSVTGASRISMVVGQASNADADFQDRIRLAVQNSAGTVICLLFSNVDVADGLPHSVFASFNGDTGEVTFIIDGVSADNVSAVNRVAPTTGTLMSANPMAVVGASTAIIQFFPGKIGFVGYRDVYLTTWSNFMHPDGTPKPLDETTWTQWGGVQPLFWHEAGKMDENKGSAGAMTKNGMITLASALA